MVLFYLVGVKGFATRKQLIYSLTVLASKNSKMPKLNILNLNDHYM